jgi:ABC-2 type transport system ATP-binding protein
VRITTNGNGVELARDLVGTATVSAVQLGDDGITVDTDDVERFSRMLPVAAVETGTTLRRVEPVGDDLESVYAYLHDRARGAAR